MTKAEFLTKLEAQLKGIPKVTLEETIQYYDEIISDKVEEGEPEEAAVAELGEISDIAASVISEVPFLKLVGERLKPNRALKIWEIILLVLGSPLWITLLAAALVVVLSLYIVIWAIDISVWALDLGFAAFGTMYSLTSVLYLFSDGINTALLSLGLGLISLGLGILLFPASLKLTKCLARLSKLIFIGIKRLFIRKEK